MDICICITDSLCWAHGFLFYHLQKINFEWIRDINIRVIMIKILEENVRDFCDAELHKDFLDMTQKTKTIKKLINFL